jgi:hypothetical protein
LRNQPIAAYAATLIVAGLGTGLVHAQAPATGPAALRCSNIQELEPAHAAALIYYIAGYEDAIRDAQTQTAGGTTQGLTATEGVSAAAGAGVGTLTLSAQAIITACSQSPDSRIADVIISQGGSGVSPASPQMTAPDAGAGDVGVGVDPESELTIDPDAEPGDGTEPAPPITQ